MLIDTRLVCDDGDDEPFAPTPRHYLGGTQQQEILHALSSELV